MPPWLTQVCAWLHLGTEATRAVDVPMPAAPLGWRQPRESKEDGFFWYKRAVKWETPNRYTVLWLGAPNRSLEKATPKCLYRSKSSFCSSLFEKRRRFRWFCSFCWWKCLKGEEIGIIQMSDITFGTLPPSFTTQLRTSQKTPFCWGGMLPPVTWKSQGFLLQKAVQEQSYGPPPPPPLGNLGKRGSVSSLIGGSLKTRQMVFFSEKDWSWFRNESSSVPPQQSVGFFDVWMKSWSCEGCCTQEVLCFFPASMIQRCAYGCSVCGFS